MMIHIFQALSCPSHFAKKKRDLEHETLMDSNHANISTVKNTYLAVGISKLSQF